MNLDLLIFIIYLISVFAVGIVVSYKQKGEYDDYFLAGRNLTWWVIGGSIIAANISTHHFIGMAGQGVTVGLAIASYEWLAAIALILYGKFFLPYYLKERITTMPEFLEKRFNYQVRLGFSVLSLIGYIFIELAVVLYTGSLAIESLFGLPLGYGLTILCIIAGGYTIYGGLEAVAYTDVLQVTVLIVGGMAVTILGLIKVGEVSPGYTGNVLGGVNAILTESPDKFEMVKSWNHPELPWIGVFFGGLWLANIFYWGCNQFITQKTLAAKDIWHGRMGVVFAGYLKLLVPFLVVLPGIIAFHLYDSEVGLLKSEAVLDKADLAFPILVEQLLPNGISGLVMAGLMGAVMSTIASLLNSSSTIFTFDIYKRHFNIEANNKTLIRYGRYTIVSVLIIATIFGYFLQNLPAIFTYIQKFWSLAWPAISAIFIAGFFYPRANAKGCLVAIILGPLWAIGFMVAGSYQLVPELAFLNRAAIDFIFCSLLIWWFRTKGDSIPKKAIIDRQFSQEVSKYIQKIPWYSNFTFWSFLLIGLIVILYIKFF